MSLPVKPRSDRFEVMPNTSSNALTMALKKASSGMENQAPHSPKSRRRQSISRKAGVPVRRKTGIPSRRKTGVPARRKTSVPARDPELGHMDSCDESRQSTISDPSSADSSISSEQIQEMGQEIIWVEE
jgi:hypothetical protein